jgi:hypothetical protein
MPMINTLADLLAPISVFDFLDAFRAGRRLHVRTNESKRLEMLLPWQRIEAVLDWGASTDRTANTFFDQSARRSTPHLIIMRDDVEIPRKFFTIEDRFSVRAFHDLAKQGVSVVVNFIDMVVPTIGLLAASIERDLSVKTWVNAYLSFSKGGAFRPHRDDHDVLVAQIHGSKKWQIWNADIKHPVGNKMKGSKINVDLPPNDVIELGPGDILFIPRGEPHSAAVSSKISVHLTIGLSHMTAIDFIDYLREQAHKDVLLRMNLPRHLSEEETSAHESAVKRSLTDLINRTKVAEFLQADDQRRSPYLHAAVTGTLPKRNDVIQLTLRRRIPLPNVVTDGAAQAVTIGQEVCSLSPVSISIIAWLFDHGPASRSALDDAMVPQYGETKLEEGLHELLRFGFLSIAENTDIAL